MSASSPPGFGRKFCRDLGKHLSTRVPGAPGSGVLSLSCQEGARRECVDPNYIPIRQQMIVVGDEGPFRCCAQRCEFSIVPIADEDEGVRIDGAGKLPFWLEENSDPLPVEAWNSVQRAFRSLFAAGILKSVMGKDRSRDASPKRLQRLAPPAAAWADHAINPARPRRRRTSAACRREWYGPPSSAAKLRRKCRRE